MANEINGKRIAFLVAPNGVDHNELVILWEAVKDAGGKPMLLSTAGGSIMTVRRDEKGGEIFLVDGLAGSLKATDFSALVLPGGADHVLTLRGSSETNRIITEFVLAGKPVAAISQAPAILISAGVLDGKSLTGWPGMADVVLHAGAKWADKDVHFCPNNNWMLITGRSTQALPKFTEAMVRAFI
ncbi:DJ-1/PfpI family protein [Arthrobacter sp. BF1]|uniref:DJ-1/PfpI family protein n=1 Tax=Arthrobacter sp. BF1 TaxID=2821145 RepID=UPI001C4EF8CE